MCRALASEHGHQVVAVYVDDGISASTFKSRPGWAHLLADLEAGKTDVLVAQSEDRFTRQPMEKETLVLDVGRPRALTDEQAALATRMRQAGESVSTIARTLGCSQATAYRYSAHEHSS